MRFGFMTDLGRTSPEVPVSRLIDEALELVCLADEGGFETAFCGEHHGIELTIAPNPFILLASWAHHVKRIRLGTAVVCAPYWHPLRLAGEAGLVDQISGGRLEMGIGRGAYPYEFARMGRGIPPEVAREYLRELVPALKGLWAGDYTHEGTKSFPSASAVPRPVQKPHPPLWISARHPDVFRFAVSQRCNVMATPLHWGFEEVVSLRQRLDDAVAADGGQFVPQLMVLCNTCVYEDLAAWRMPVDYLCDNARYFRNLFSDLGDVRGGFPEPTDLGAVEDKDYYTPENVWKNHIFGTPEQVTEKMRQYEEAGVDVFLYGAGWKLPHVYRKRSLKLFVSEVMPAFAESRSDNARSR